MSNQFLDLITKRRTIYAIAQLRSKHFNTPQEQLRVETFEQVHDQGAKLPFAD